MLVRIRLMAIGRYKRWRSISRSLPYLLLYTLSIWLLGLIPAIETQHELRFGTASICTHDKHVGGEL